MPSKHSPTRGWRRFLVHGSHQESRSQGGGWGRGQAPAPPDKESERGGLDSDEFLLLLLLTLQRQLAFLWQPGRYFTATVVARYVVRSDALPASVPGLGTHGLKAATLFCFIGAEVSLHWAAFHHDLSP